MTGTAGNRERCVTDGRVIYFEKAFVYFTRHPHHLPCYFLFRLFITGIIRFVRVFVFGMTKSAGYTQSISEIIHHDFG